MAETGQPAPDPREAVLADHELTLHTMVSTIGVCSCGEWRKGGLNDDLIRAAHRVHVVGVLDSTGQDTTDPADEPTEDEDDLWEQLWDTDAACSCSCPPCNYYARDYYDHKDEPCILQTLIERIIAARQRPTAQADHTEAAS